MLSRFPRSRRFVVSLVIACSIVGAVLFGAVTHAEFDPAAIFLPTLTATKSDTSLSGDGDGKADPGETIGYTVQIGNTGADPATGVTFNDTIDAHTTLVPGSVNVSPLARDDSYATVGNTQLEVGVAASGFPAVQAAGSVFDNDSEFLGDTFSLQAPSPTTSANGGTVTMNASGNFTYLPPTGFTGTDTFTYTITDGALTGTGTVSIVVSERVWYVKNNAPSGGTGRSNSPFDTLVAAQTASAANDYIYVYAGDGTTTGQNAGITLKNGQRFIGQGVALVVGANTLVAAGAAPIIGNAAGNGITLAQNNTIRGLNVGNSSGTAISGTGFGTLNLSSVSINTSGRALDVSSGTAGTVTFNSITSTGGANNVILTGLNGTWDLGSGALSGATGSSFQAGAGNGVLNYSGTIATGTGRSVDIQSKTVGSVNLSGAITDTDLGINLQNNTGGTINITGGINASTGAVTAFSATGGGTINVTQNNTSIVNTLTTTTATALNITNTTIGASGITFRSISSNGGTSDGIILDNTGATAGLTVVGDGSNTSVGGNGTGGTIQNKSGANGSVTSGIGIYLNNTTNVVLRRMTINGTNQNFGIRGTSVSGFTLEYSTVGGSNGTNYNTYPALRGEGSIYFGTADDVSNPTPINGVIGTATLTNNNISGGEWNNVSFIGASGTSTYVVKGNTFGLNLANGQGNQSLAFEARGTATMNSTVGGTLAGEPNTFTGSRSDILNFTGQQGTTMDCIVRNNTLTNNHTQNNIGGNSMFFQGSGTMTFHVTGNNMRDANGSAVTFFKGQPSSGPTPSMTGYFDNNIIGNAAVADSGSKTGNGIFVSAGGTGTMSFTITNNQIHQIKGNAHIYADNTGGSYTANFDIRGNTIDTPGAGWFAGIAITNGSPSSTDTVNVCSVIGGASAADKNTLNVAGGLGVIVGSSGANGGHTFNIPGYAGGANLTNVETFLTNNNTGAFTTDAYADAPATASAFTGVAGCGTPTSRPESADGNIEHPPTVGDDLESLGVTSVDYKDSPLPRPEYMTPLARRMYLERNGTPYQDPEPDKSVRTPLAKMGGSLSIEEETEIAASGVMIQGLFDIPDDIGMDTQPKSAPFSIGTFANRVISTIIPTVAAQNIITNGDAKPNAPQSGESISITIGTLPAAKTLTITFSVTVDALDSGEIRTRILNQATADSNETAPVLTTDPVASADPACTAAPAIGSATCTPVDRPDTSVVSLTRQSGNPTTNPSVTWQVVFADPVNGLNSSNFSLLTTGTVAGATLSVPTETSGPPSTTWNIAATGITGDGTLELRMANSTGLSHDVTNLPYTQPTNGAVYTIDNTPPSTTSFTRFNPATSPTNADTLVFRATFSENVTNVNAADFVVTGTTATVTGVAGVGGGPDFSVYDITVSGGDLAGLNGTVGLNFNGAQDITDLANNPLPNAEPATDQTYLVDNIAPTVNIVDVSPDPRTTAVASVAINFSENVTGFDIADLTLTRNAGANLLPGGTSLTGGPANYTLSSSTAVTTPDGAYVLTLSAGGAGITDAAGNALAVGDVDDWIKDTVPPTVTINQAGGQSDPTFQAPINFTVVFNEPVTDFDDPGDLTLSSTGPGTLSGVITGGPSTYNVAVSGMTSDGVVTASVNANAAADAAGNLSVASTSTDNSVTFVTCVAPPANMKGWYTGDNTTRDIAGGNDGTFAGTTAYAPGKVDQAFSFNGSTLVSRSAPSTLNLSGNQVTLDGWINPSVVSGDAIYFGKTANASNDFVVLRIFNQLVGIVKVNGTEVTAISGFDPPANTWTHIAMTYNGSSVQLYVNGVAAGTPASGSGNITNDGVPFYIGGRGDGKFFNGLIDEVEVFDRALSLAEINSIYTADGGGKCKVSDLRVDKAHVGSFTQGAAGSYTVTVSNDGPKATSGTTTMTDTLPVGLTPGTPTAPSGWTCPAPVGQAVSCTSTDVVAAAASFPVITIPVTVTQNSPLSVTNTATVSGGGELDTSDDSDADPTTIVGVAQTPNVSTASTVHGAQTTSGLVILPNPSDGAEVTHFKITNILNGTLFQNDGTTPITAGSFITTAQGGPTGLRFTPSFGFIGTAHFTVQASVSNSDTGLGGATVVADITVSKADTTLTALTDAPDPSVVGQPYTTGFTLNIVAPGAGTPTGTVSVNDGAGGTCTATLPATSCQLTSIVTGNKTLTFSYGGDSSFNGSTNTAGHAVNKADTTTTITADTPDPSVIGQNYAVTASVIAAAPGSGTPTGTITVTDGTNNCTITLPATSCNLPSTSTGAKTLSATYNSDANFNGSTSAGVPHTVNKADSTITITNAATLSTTPTVVGQPYAVNVTVAAAPPGAGTPGGTVSVSDGSGATCTITLAGGSGTCNLTSTTVGTPKTITATYNNDANFNGSSTTTTHTVNKANTALINITESLDPTSIDQPYTVGFTLNVSAPGAGTPTGTVTISDGTGDTCTATLPATNCQLQSLTQGVKTLTVTYNGDANFNTSNNSAIHQVLCTPNPVVTNANNSGPGSLRKAVADACSAGGQNTITFAPGPLPNEGGGEVSEASTDEADAVNVAGPILLSGGEIVLTSNVIIQGPAGGTMVIQNTKANSSTSHVFVVGGGTATLNNLTITGGNTDGSVKGGGIFVSGTLNLNDSTVTGNNAITGGGVFVGGGGVANVVRSTVSGNNANFNGGVGADGGGTFNLSQSTVSGNTASNGGAVFANGGANATITNTTISGNSLGIDSNSGSVTIRGSIVAKNNAGGDDLKGPAGTVTSLGFNFIGNPGTFAGGTFPTGSPNANNDIVGSSGTPLDPQLAPLANNGGPTRTMAICTSAGVPHVSCGALSQVIDKGKDFVGSGFDQRGNGTNQVRPFDIAPIANAAGGDGSDVGAYELNNTPPTITAAPTTRQAGSPTANSQVATAGDLESPVNTLTLTVNGGNTATVNGVTATLTDSNGAAAGTNPTAAGAVMADVVAACGATTATFTLTVTDGGGLSTNATLTVTVDPNTPPVLTYNNPAAVVFGQNGINISPATGPSDNGSVTSVQLQSAGTFTGNVSVNANGTIAISNAGPAGTHTISIRATDNCGAQTTATFQITVNKANTATGVQVSVNAPTYGSQLTATATIVAVPPGSGTPQGTVNFFDGANPITGCQNVPVTALGAAVCSTNTLPAGVNKSISAQYSGNTNFNPSTGAATQTIDKVQLTVQASSATVTYGDAAPGITSTITGFVLGETAANLTTQPSCSTTYTQGSAVSGSQYPASCSGAVSNNYSFNYLGGNVTVNKKALTVAADNKSRTYGTANPALTATLSGFVLGQNLATSGVTGTPTLSTTATATSPAGTYPITVTLGTLQSGNYSFGTFTNGTLTVNTAQLTITADNQTRVYGAPNPALTFQITGFVNGEGVGVLTGTPSVTTTATATSAPGTYPITVAQGTLASANYTFATANGTLTVTTGSTTTTITNAAALGTATSVGQSYPVNWTTTPIAPATGTPTGNVTVTDGSQTCTAAVAVGTCSLTSTTSGTKTITATYAGDANFTGSTSQSVQHNVVIGLTGNVKQFVAFGTNTNLAGVTITLTNTTTQQSTTTTTDASGNYSFVNVTLGQNFTITPSGLGKVYEATSRTYNNAGGNISGADFLAYDIVGPNSIPRSARVQSQIATQGQPVTVPILFTATGVETKVSFSVEYPATALGIPTVTCGTGTPNCTVTIDNSLSGKAGITVTPANSNPLTAGTREIVKITFPTFTSPATSAQIRFGDFPQAKDVRNAENNALPTLYWTDGLVSFTGGTLLDGATISGRVTTAAGQGLRNATVTLLDSAGGRRTTLTSSFGNYQFEGLDTGRDYMLIVTSKRYRFATQRVTLNESLGNVNLVGLE
ncbi:MAG: Ig-like domain repeat protein [Pyrinomonadaceae bacterium]